MNVGTFENLQYTVTVTKLTSTSVKITPSTGDATKWTATLTNVLGVYTCITCVTNSQITFTSIGNGVSWLTTTMAMTNSMLGRSSRGVRF
jgi:hypothetical protein